MCAGRSPPAGTTGVTLRARPRNSAPSRAATAAPVPSADVRAWRELINCRGQIVAKRTRAKNTLRTLLRSAGVVPPKKPGLWTKKGLAWLRRVELPTASQRLRRDLLLEEVEALT